MNPNLKPETRATLERQILEAAEVAFGKEYLQSNTIRITFPVAAFADFTFNNSLWYKEMTKFIKQINGITVLSTGIETTGPKVDYKLTLKPKLLSVKGTAYGYVLLKASIGFKEVA